jgi:acid phosphatase
MMRTTRNTKFIILSVGSLLLGVVIGSSGLMTSLAWQSTSPQTAAVNPQEHALDANLYMQTAAEYQAVCLQTYNLATERLRQKLAASRLDGSPPAVVMDLDETVLDNSAFQSFLDRERLNYSDALWGIWERDFPQEVGLIPGAKAFIEAAEQLGVTVVYISNRDEKLRASTIAALRQNGLSLERIDSRLLLKTTTSDKTERRKIAEGRFNALIYIGDNLRDFSEEFKSDNSSCEIFSSMRMLRGSFLPSLRASCNSVLPSSCLLSTGARLAMTCCWSAIRTARYLHEARKQRVAA